MNTFKFLYNLFSSTHITYNLLYLNQVYAVYWPVPVAAHSKAQVYGRSPAAIVSSNPTGVMDVCLL